MDNLKDKDSYLTKPDGQANCQTAGWRLSNLLTSGYNVRMSTKSMRNVFVCQKCGGQSRKWLGKCPDCGEWNSFVEERERAAPGKAGNFSGGLLRGSLQLKESHPIPFAEIETQADVRDVTGIAEFDRVLGGGIVPGSLVLIGGEPGVGKCLAGSTRIFDPDSGLLLPISQWLQKGKSVLALEEATHRLTPLPVKQFLDQGIQPVVEVTTRLGHTLRCTSSHPLLTPAGWQSAGHLAPGARLASPLALPYFGQRALPEATIRLIAYMLSDGSALKTISVTAAITEIAEDLAVVAQSFGMELKIYARPNSSAKQYRFTQPHSKRKRARMELANAIRRVQNEAELSWAEWARQADVTYARLNAWRRAKSVPGETELERLAVAAGVPLKALMPEARGCAQMTTNVARLLESVGLRFVRAAEKAVPECIFQLPRQQMAMFLKVLFSCDGSVYLNQNNVAGLSYSTISRRLAEDIQHLLLRFGIIARLRRKESLVNDRSYLAYELQALGAKAVKRFLAEIGIWGRTETQARIAALPEPRTPSTQRDTIPTGEVFWRHLREVSAGISFKQISARAGVTIHTSRETRPLCRSTVQALAHTYPSDYLDKLACSDVYWDEVKSITSVGEEQVYDLTVPPHSNFVANDLIVHNSTLLAQVADKVSQLYGNVLYVSGEESERQIKLRGERLNINPDGLFLLSETNLERIFDEINRLQPRAVIIDSIQTVYSEKIESAPGSVSQVREAAGQFLLLAKNLGLPVFLIGHVTKEGMIAGPKALEHIVDTVLYFEGERHHNHRIIRAAKNRFGAANELGVFEMTEHGLVGVANPSEVFLSERPLGVSGSAVLAAMEGTRPMLVEIQALVSSSKFGAGRRTTQGVELNRVALLVAMLEKRVGFHLLGDDIFVNLVGGITLDEPAADLGIVAAIASSFRNIPINEHTIVFGEVGLAGEVRGVNQAAVRLREAAHMGFRRVIMPQNNLSGMEKDDRVETIGVRSVVDALEALF
jgi:DNA repair protein RadA/Sms